MGTIMTMGAIMTTADATLAAWFSPAYPVGAFSYSHGLERVIADGAVCNADTLTSWVTDILEHGAGWTDAILLVHAANAPEDNTIADLAAALAPSKERHLETMAQGTAFARVTAAAWGGPAAGGDIAYPVAVGRAAAACGLPVTDTAAMYLQAFAANLVSVGVRLVPLGQTDGQKVLVALLPTCRSIAERTQDASLDDIGGIGILADIASMRHETHTPRFFQS